jgi:Spy/CpxP family protein refolding chaperone
MKTAFPFLLLVIILLIPASTFAQGQLSEGQKKETLERYKSNMALLNLTEDQKPEVQAIEKEFFDAVSSLRNSDGSKMEKYRRFKTINKNRDKQMKEVLTKEQYRVFKDNQEQTKKNLRQRRKQVVNSEITIRQVE